MASVQVRRRLKGSRCFKGGGGGGYGRFVSSPESLIIHFWTTKSRVRLVLPTTRAQIQAHNFDGKDNYGKLDMGQCLKLKTAIKSQATRYMQRLKSF